MSDEALKKIGDEFVVAIHANNRQEIDRLGRLAGDILVNISGDLFFTADENRSELMKNMDPRLIEATISTTPALASSTVKAVLGGTSAYFLHLETSTDSTNDACAQLCDKNKTYLARSLCTALIDEALATSDGRWNEQFCGDWLTLRRFLTASTIPHVSQLWDERTGLLVRPSSKNEQLQYFAFIPGYPSRVRPDVLMKQMNFIRIQLHAAQDAVVKMIEKCLKLEKKKYQDGILAWLARGLALATEPALQLNLAYTVLQLVAPLVNPNNEKSHLLLDRVDLSCGVNFGRGFSSEEPLLVTVEDKTDIDLENENQQEEDDMLLAKALEMSLTAPIGFRGGADSAFLTEIFWLAERALGVITKCWESKRAQQKTLSAIAARCSNKELVDAVNLHFSGGWSTMLHDPRLLNLACDFATAAMSKLVQIASSSDTQKVRLQFSNLPASLVKNACNAWIYKLNTMGDIMWKPGPAALCCCFLMRRGTELITSPLVHTKLVDVVSSMIFASGFHRSTHPYAGNFVRGRHQQLAGAIMDQEIIRRELPVALASLYAQLQAIVGLDVDKDTGFDKFNVRHRINDLLIRLWRHPLGESKTALSAFLADNCAFTTACLDTIGYCVEDAIDRIRDGAAIEKNIPLQNPDLSIEDRLDARRRQYYESQRRLSHSFLNTAYSTLELTAEIPIYLKNQVAFRASSLCMSLLAKLIDPTRPGELPIELSVDAPAQRWGLNHSQLVDFIMKLLEACNAQAGPECLRRAFSQLDQIDNPNAILIAIPAANTLQRAVYFDKGDESSADKHTDASVLALVECASNGDSIDHETAYAKAFEQISTVELLSVDDDGTSSLKEHYFCDRLTSTSSIKPLQKELRQLQRDLPPPHIDGSFFIRFDETSLQRARCCVAGPEGTPYYGGLFVFDVYFPPTYPNLPPLVQLMTTGNGIVRFNPNLYSDGKVCLSLLGTWHGDESEKWDPKKSSLRQILLSIQAEIFVREPYFNEPGRDLQRGTPEGANASALLNADLRIKTLRYAIAEYLRFPPAGLEQVAKTHFKYIRPKLLMQCRTDLRMAPQQLKSATRRAISDLIQLFNDEHFTKSGPSLECDLPPTKRAKQISDNTTIQPPP